MPDVRSDEEDTASLREHSFRQHRRLHAPRRARFAINEPPLPIGRHDIIHAHRNETPQREISRLKGDAVKCLTAAVSGLLISGDILPFCRTVGIGKYLFRLKSRHCRRW